MEVLGLLMYVGAVWVVGAVGLFVWNVACKGHEHADRLAILPLEDNWTDPVVSGAARAAPPPRAEPSGAPPHAGAAFRGPWRAAPGEIETSAVSPHSKNHAPREQRES